MGVCLLLLLCKGIARGRSGAWSLIRPAGSLTLHFWAPRTVGSFLCLWVIQSVVPFCSCHLGSSSPWLHVEGDMKKKEDEGCVFIQAWVWSLALLWLAGAPWTSYLTPQVSVFFTCRSVEKIVSMKTCLSFSPIPLSLPLRFSLILTSPHSLSERRKSMELLPHCYWQAELGAYSAWCQGEGAVEGAIAGRRIS